MAPNLLGNSLIIAESCIDNEVKPSRDDDSNSTTLTCRNIPQRNNKNLLNDPNEHENDQNNKQQSIENKPERPKDVPEVQEQKNKSFKSQLVWRNIIAFIYLHTGALYGIYLMIYSAKWQTTVFAFVAGSFGAFGITAGAHRLWSHRSYKARWPLRLYLMILQTLSFQNSIYEWTRDHRVHHKYTDTNADPHNSKRGFFFSHIGWLMMKKHPDVKAKGSKIDMSDLEADDIVMFQKNYYVILVLLFCFIIPTLIPMYIWGETFSKAWYVAAIFRYTLTLNATWLVNSAAHIWGMKPFDKSISPANNKFVAMASFGEGWHNYHHVFPWDYKTSELGKYGLNFTTAFIDLFAKIGLSYDLKTVSTEMIRKRVLRTGDGSHKFSNSKYAHEQLFDYVNNNISDEDLIHSETPVWGWNDEDMKLEDKQDAKIINKIE